MQHHVGLSLLLACAALIGCASGPKYALNPLASAAVPPTVARITVLRTGEHVQYSARNARLRLGGRRYPIPPGSYRIVDVPPGEQTLVVDMWDAPGSCSLRVRLPAGKACFFEVTPRAASFLSGSTGPLVGGLTGVAVMFGGMVIESAGKPCGGAFALAPLEDAVAREKLRELRSAD